MAEYHAIVGMPVNQDALHITLVRYNAVPGVPASSEYRDTEGYWHAYSGFDLIQPTIVLRGDQGLDVIVDALVAWRNRPPAVVGAVKV